MTIRTSRLAALATAPLLAIGVLAAAAPAQAAPNSYAYSAARWLDDQLTDGLATYPTQFGPYTDYGLSIDVLLTLKSLDTRTATQAKIVSALAEHVGDYTTGGSFTPDDRYAGATGKLASAVQAAGSDATSFGGVDLVARAEERVQPNGRATDRSTYDANENGTIEPEEISDYSNTVGQTWVVRALSTAGSSDAASTLSYLLKQQCSDGSFRINLDDAQCTTPGSEDSISIDATALAAQTLGAIETPAAQAAADKAIARLKAVQADDGSFSDDGTPNTNTTGLAATALAAAGEKGAAGNAAAWIVDKQVTDANAEDTKLGTDLGAIAYDKAAFDAGIANGIADDQRGQWLRASAQAAAGINAQLPRKTLTVSAPTKYFAASTLFTATVGGLEPGEKFTVRHGSTVKRGTAGANGTGSVELRSASRTTNVTITATGARTARAGEAVIKVLAKKTLGVSASSTSVKRGGTTTVKVTGLAASEPVRIRYRSKTVSSGQATASGTYTYTLKVGTVTGKKTVYAFGKFDNRTGTRGVTVK